MSDKVQVRSVLHVFLLTLIVLGQSVFMYVAVKEMVSTRESVELLMISAERSSLLNYSLADKIKVNGVYWSGKFYSVWTDGRSDEEIVSDDPYLSGIGASAAHEYCHHLVHEDFGHFCEGKKSAALLGKEVEG